MKMGFVFSGVFWGIVLVLLGVSVILKTVFNIQIPVLRLVLAFLLIVLGIQVLVGWGRPQAEEGTVVFGERTFEAAEKPKYATVFGKSRLRLTPASPVREIDTVFGETVLVVPEGLAVVMKCDAVLASVRFPGGTVIAMGSYTWRSPAFEESKPHLEIESATVLGSMEVRVGGP